MFLVLALLAAGIALAPPCARGQNGQGTKILSYRQSAKGNLTRLIFDAEGARPTQVGPASADGISVFFTQMSARIPDRKLDSSAAAKSVVFRREAGFFEILFKEKNTQVTHSISPGRKPGRYTLVVELRPPDKSQPQRQETPKEASKPSAPPVPASASEPIRRVETSELFRSKGQAIPKNLLVADEKRKQEGGAERAPAAKPLEFAEIDERTASLFNYAEERFESCRRNLVLCGPEIIQTYGEALSAGPKSARAPLGFYRTGLAHWSMGQYAKAERLFRYVISEWPDHPAASRAWVGVGDIYNKRQSHVEAMEAFRAALRAAVEKEDKAAAYFELGRQYFILGAPKEALDMLGQCSSQDPDFYIKRPELVRLVGEAEFSLGQYQSSRDHLIRYINIQQSAPDQDLVYAKIAETLLNQGDTLLASKIHDFVKKYFTDSEGDIICRIRQAELLERTNPKQSQHIYDQICSKDLSPNLQRIVSYKLAVLAWKMGSLDRSLELIDEVFQGRVDRAPPSEMAVLRGKILVDMIKKAFSEKNYLGVIQLHDRYRKVLDGMPQDQELGGLIAGSYGILKFHAKALEVLEQLLAGSQKKSEDVLLKCALYAVLMGDQAKAAQFCKQIQSENLDLKKSEILGHIATRDQKYADAAKYFGKVLAKKEFDLAQPDSYYGYAYSLYQAKKFDEAVPVLEKGLEKHKDDVDARRAMLVLLGRCLAELTQYAKAAETMEMALALAKEDQANDLRYELSKLLAAAGQFDKAVQNLNELIGAKNPFWTAVAQQQLNSIQMARTSQSR